METYRVVLNIRAECESDAKELINDYSGEQTEIEILSIQRSR